MDLCLDQILEVVGGNFFCADIMARRCIEALNELQLVHFDMVSRFQIEDSLIFLE